MFWIIGAEDVVHALAKATGAPWADKLAYQFDHSDWVGFRFYDLIFPMFVFIVGASAVFSLTKILATSGRAAAVRRVIIRGIVLYAFGLLYYGNRADTYFDPRLMGVLQRIAIAYTATGLLFIFFRPRVLLGITAALLVGYWAIMTFIPAPGQPHVSFNRGENLANWVDTKFLPYYKWEPEDKNRIPRDGLYDPEGILSTFPAIASCLLGLFAGLLLKNERVPRYLKVLALVAGGAAAVTIGFYWGAQFPVIKKLWTSSFVLVAAGYSSMLLGLFYLIIDVFQFRVWARPFVWIGMNAITLYLLWQFVKFDQIADHLLGGKYGQQVLGQAAPLASAILALLLILLVARFLYKRQIFLRV